MQASNGDTVGTTSPRSSRRRNATGPSFSHYARPPQSNAPRPDLVPPVPSTVGIDVVTNQATKLGDLANVSYDKDSGNSPQISPEEKRPT